MEIAGVKRNPAQYQGCVADVRGADQLGAVCDWADILLLTAPANPDRSHLIGAAELERLGHGWIVNVGRGSLIDEPALVRALETGALRGAGLDVTAVEPLPARFAALAPAQRRHHRPQCRRQSRATGRAGAPSSRAICWLSAAPANG